MNRIVLVESPFAAPTPEGLALNTRYLRACLRDCLVNRNEAPFASHAIYTLPGVLRDDVPVERVRGMEAGWEFLRVAELVAVYRDLGISRGMIQGIERATHHGVPIEHRSLGVNWGPSAEMDRLAATADRVLKEEEARWGREQAERPFSEYPPNGTLCSVCGLAQRKTPGGLSCVNGHGGAEPAGDAGRAE